MGKIVLDRVTEFLFCFLSFTLFLGLKNQRRYPPPPLLPQAPKTLYIIFAHLRKTGKQFKLNI